MRAAQELSQSRGIGHGSISFLSHGLSNCMGGESGFPRRKRIGSGRPPRDSQTSATLQTLEPGPRVAPREALDVARYVTDMTAQLEAMAIAAQLDILAYFLGMAKSEGDLFVRTNAQAGRPDGDREEIEVGDPHPYDDRSFD
jgi:hypothetical protein